MWERLGLALLHFLWHGVLVAAVAAVAAAAAAWLPRGRKRYGTYLLGLGAMIGCLPATLLLVRVDSVGHLAATTTAAIAADAPAPVAVEVSARMSVTSDRSITTDARQWLADVVRTHDLLVTAVWVWLVGAGLLSVRLPLAWLAVARLRREALPAGMCFRDRAAFLSRRIGLRRTVDVLASTHVVQPVVTGCLRPAILLPVSFLTELPLATLEAVIAHELAHVLRRDLWVVYAQRLAETLLFYHPAVWWLSSRVSEEREICCDDLAVAATGQRLEYATALAEAARQTMARPSMALALGTGRRVTLRRVRRVLGLSPATPAWGWASGLAAVAVVVTLFGIGCGLARSRGGAEGGPPNANASVSARVNARAATTAPTASAATATAKPRVLLVTSGDFFLERAVAAGDAFAVDIVAPDRYDAGRAGGYDVLVFHDWAPPGEMPGVPTLFWNVAPSALSPDGAGAAAEDVNAPVTKLQPDHPLVRDLNLSRVVVARARRLTPRSSDLVLASAGKTPLIVEYVSPAGRPNVLVAFTPADSSWPSKSSFPIFVHNAIHRLTGKDWPPPKAVTTTRPTTTNIVRQYFRPTTTGSGKTSWSGPIPDRTRGPNAAFMIVTAHRGDRWPVRTRTGGPPIFHGKVVDGGQNHVVIEIDDGADDDDGDSPRRQVTLKLNVPQALEITGRRVILGYGETNVKGTEPQDVDHATISVHFTSEDDAGGVHVPPAATAPAARAGAPS